MSIIATHQRHRGDDDPCQARAFQQPFDSLTRYGGGPVTTVRRNAARPRSVDAPHPSASIICPRYAWPTLWSSLVDAGCNIWTGAAQPSPNPACSHAAPVEVLVTRRGLEVARRHGLAPQQEAHGEPADRLDAAIAVEIERIRVMQQGGNRAS